MYEAVIFDWDGTLADTKWVIVTSFQKVFRQIACEVTDEFIERRIGIGIKNTFVEALQEGNIHFNEEKIDELAEKKIAAQIELTQKVKLFEGAIDLLNSLHNRIRIALASMSNREVLDKLMDETGVGRYFDVVIAADEVLHPKPDPEVFLKCAAKLDCPPENCVVVEDSIFGVKAAKKAKMECIAILTGAYSGEELEEENPDLIVNSLKEREKLLAFILC